MSVNPFPGPQPYRAADRELFCGREDVAKRLASTIVARRCITLFGPSGGGKSSIMQAAVIPELIDARDVRAVRVDSWPADRDRAPADWLLAAIFEQLRLGDPPEGMKPIDLVGAAIERAERRSSRPILIYLDQMEQLLLQDRDPANLDVFITCVDRLAGQPLAGLHVVLAMREDYLGRFRDRARGRRRLLENGFRLGPLTVGDIVVAVCAAATRGDPPQTWDPDEIKALMLEVRTPGQSESDDAEVEAAYAQIVCRALFAERASGEHAHAGPRGAVRAEPILQEYLETTLKALGKLRQEALHLLENHLIAADGSRTLLTEKEARAALPDGAFEPILRALEAAAVLRSEAHHGSRYFEIGHDWLAKKVHERRQRAAMERVERERREREEAEEKAKVQRAAHKRLVVFAVFTVCGLTVTSAATIMALKKRGEALAAQQQAVVEQQRGDGERLRARELLLIAGARELLGRDRALWAAQLLLESKSPESMEALGWRDLALTVLGRATISTSLEGHGAECTSVGFTRDGRRVITASEDGTARVWSADGTGNPIVIAGRAGAVLAACSAKDGERVFTASEEGTMALWSAGSGALIKDVRRRSPVRFAVCGPLGRALAVFEDNKVFVWDASSENGPLELTGASSPLRAGAFSADGARVAVVVDGGPTGPEGRRQIEAAFVWNVERPAAPLVIKSNGGSMVSAAWSPDGQKLALTAEDGSALLYNLGGGGSPVVLSGHKGVVVDASWSPDGEHIVTASWDKTARIWRADGEGDPVVLKGHDGAVFAVAWSPDGRRIVTASRDATARLWQSDGAGDPTVLKGHAGPVVKAAWSPDGKRVATISSDKSARVWTVGGAKEPLVLEGHESRVSYAAFSADGARVLTASEDATARVWPVNGASPPVVLRGGDDLLRSASMSPDGKLVALAMADGGVRLWRADGSGEPAVLRGHTGWVTTAVFSPDGKRLASASEDGTARIWDIDGGAGSIVLKGHSSWVHSVAWSPDGERVATGSADQTARVWSADGEGKPVVLKNNGGVVMSVQWSPAGDRLLAVSGDSVARVWSADGRGEAAELRGHEAWINSARFSPDGRRVVTGSKDKTARIWSVDGSELSILSGHDAGVAMAAFSPDGARVLTASGDGVARIWSAPESGTPVVLNVLEGHSGAILYASWSADGQRIVTASSDGTARVYSPFVPLAALRERLVSVGGDCLPPTIRAAYVDEPMEEANVKFMQCERSKGRVASLGRVESGGSLGVYGPSQGPAGAATHGDIKVGVAPSVGIPATGAPIQPRDALAAPRAPATSSASNSPGMALDDLGY